ncbi:MAG: flagellar basal body P-ring formation protein FlgA [Betaproteobacteria bacterium]|nr:flagellar basal body P-ring formation protein FlgA [Betaproteobacteria bacterium]
MKTIRWALASAMLAANCAVQAGLVEDAALRFVQQQTAGLGARVEVSVDPQDMRQRQSDCRSFEPFLPSGARLYGRVTVALRCAQGGGATLFVPVHVRVFAPALVASRPLAPGQVLSAADVRVQEMEVTQPGILSDPAQVVGKNLSVGLNPGVPVRSEMLRLQQVVAQGDTVRVQAFGPGFAISAEGTASAHATDGQSVQVRTASGRILTGTARPGRIVEVKY